MFKIFYKTPMKNLRNQLLRVFTSRRDSNYGAVMPFSTAFQVNSAGVEAYYSKASKYTTNDSKMTAILALDFMRLDTETEKRLAEKETETEKRLAEKETEKRLAEKETEKRLAEKETEKRLAEKETETEKRLAEKETEKRLAEKDTETEKRLAEKETEKRLAEKETEKRLALAEKETEKKLAEAQTQNSQRESYLKSLLSAVSQRYCSLLNAKNFHLKTYRLYEPFPSLLVIDMY